MTSPYRNIPSSYPWDRLRWEKTIEFIDECWEQCHTLPPGSMVLDVGDHSGMTERLGALFSDSHIHNTSIDLDVDELPELFNYDVVVCGEVLEHLFNPLHCLLQIKSVLKPNGRLFISTPRHRPYFLWHGASHFNEMRRKELGDLLKRAGFEVVRERLFRAIPFWRGFRGIRPFIRLLIDRKFLMEVRHAV